MFIALRLSKAGYGRPDEILGMSAEIVLGMIEYEGFLSDYENECFQLNRVQK